MVRNRIRNSFQDNVFDSINFVLVTCVLVIVLYPLLFVVSASFSDPDLVTRGQVWLLPKGLTIEGYRRVFLYKDIWKSYSNTIIYAVTGAMFTLFLTLTAAYGLSKDDFPFKKLLTFVFAFTMFFSGGLIPYFLVVQRLNLINKVYTLPLLGAVGFYYIIISRTYFKTSIPNEILDAAAIDGCSNFAAFFRIVLPLSKPIISVIALYAAVNMWNGYFNALIFLRDRNLQPLQILLREILTLNQIDFNSMMDGGEQLVLGMERHKMAQLIKYAVMIVSSLPIILAYPFIQKYFVKGIMIGSIKG